MDADKNWKLYDIRVLIIVFSKLSLNSISQSKQFHVQRNTVAVSELL
jgi:hypothetical protein